MSTLIQEIPTTDRYDLTLYRYGVEKGGDIVTRWMIDSGPYAGKVVSNKVRGAWAWDDFNAQFKDKVRKLRVNALVTVKRRAKIGGLWTEVDEHYSDSDVYISYSVTDPTDPVGESEMAEVLDRQSQRFKRE